MHQNNSYVSRERIEETQIFFGFVLVRLLQPNLTHFDYFECKNKYIRKICLVKLTEISMQNSIFLHKYIDEDVKYC